MSASAILTGVETFLLMAGFYLATEKHPFIGLALGWLAIITAYTEGLMSGRGLLH